MKKITVVGGGFSGLVTAYYLSREGFSVEIHEASSRLGGLLGSERTEQGLAESAANGFINSEDLNEIFQDLGLEALPPQAEYVKKRYIYRQGLKRWPLRFFESLALISKFLLKFLFAKKSLIPQARETIWNWGLRNLTRPATDYLLRPGLQGIYAGDIGRMSAELVLGPLFQGKKKKYKGTVSLKNGMEEFIKVLAKKLESQGVRIHLNSKYQLSSLAEPHVVAVSAAAAPSVVEKVAPSLAQSLRDIEVLSVLSVTVFLENPPQKIEGFGTLFPQDQGFQVLGVLSPTYIFANRGPGYSETWIFGGTHSPGMLKKSDEEILEVIQKERARIFNSPAKIGEARIYRRPQALPHYTLAHQEILKNLQTPKNLYLAGNYLGGIGLSRILSRSKELASEMKRTLS